MGEVDEYLFKRFHLFNMFGGQVSIRPHEYIDAIRRLTVLLKEKGGVYSLQQFFEEFRSWEDVEAYRVLKIGEHFSFNDFLMLVSRHSLLFRLYTREDGIRLRHDVVPELTEQEIRAIPRFKTLEQLFATDDDGAAASGGGAAAASLVIRRAVPPGRVSDEEDDYEDDAYVDYEDYEKTLEGIPTIRTEPPTTDRARISEASAYSKLLIL